MLEYSGVPYSKLLDRLIHMALQRREAKGQTQYSR
jgi:hypothetical protein